MIKVGRVVKIDRKERSGFITDFKGKTYLFTQDQCKDQTLPEEGTRVTFLKDEDFVFANVAHLVMPLEVSKAA